MKKILDDLAVDKKEYEIKHKGFGKYAVLDENKEQANDKPLSKGEAQKLLAKLTTN